MGNCNSSGATRGYKFTLNDLQDLRIGDPPKQMEKGCGAAIEGPSAGDCQETLRNKGFGWPDNGEFEWGGMGDNCTLCDGEYGCECPGGIGGRRGRVKRKAFKGDPSECCLANMERKDAKKIVGDYTCDPKYRDPNSTDCTNIYADYCKEGDRMMTDAKCQYLAQSNSTLYNSLMKEKCNTDQYYQHSTCINWCANNSTECSKLNTFQDCQKLGISINECTPQKILDVKADCEKYGIRSQQGLAVYQCSPAGINALLAECQTNNVMDTCSPTSIQDAIDNATRRAQLDMQAKTQQQIQQNYDTTQKTIADILDVTKDTPETESEQEESQFDISNIKKWVTDNYIIAIIIAIILIVISSSSSASLLFVVLKK